MVLDEFNQAFFDKIDEIDNKISKNIDFKTIIKEFNIKPIIKKNYINLENKKQLRIKFIILEKIKLKYLKIMELLFFIKLIILNTKLPNLNDDKFTKQIKNLLFQKEKFEFNKDILLN